MGNSVTAGANDSSLHIWKQLLNTLCTLCPAVLVAAKKVLEEGTSSWLDAEYLQDAQPAEATDDDGQIVLGIFLGKLSVAMSSPAEPFQVDTNARVEQDVCGLYCAVVPAISQATFAK